MMKLHNQLHLWDYCQAQIELYNKLLGRLDAQCDSIFLIGLGLAHRSLGNYEAARLRDSVVSVPLRGNGI